MVNNKYHCIHQLLPPEKILPVKLRATNCIFALPQCHYNLYKRSFVLRYLFGDASKILHADLVGSGRLRVPETPRAAPRKQMAMNLEAAERRYKRTVVTYFQQSSQA